MNKTVLAGIILLVVACAPDATHDEVEMYIHIVGPTEMVSQETDSEANEPGEIELQVAELPENIEELLESEDLEMEYEENIRELLGSEEFEELFPEGFDLEKLKSGKYESVEIEIIEFETIEFTLDSGEIFEVQFTGDGRQYGSNSFHITGDKLFIDLVIDDDFLLSTILWCSNSENRGSPDSLSIMALSYTETMFVPFAGSRPPEPVDYSMMSGKYIDIWERTLYIFESLENNQYFKIYNLENAPDIMESIGLAIGGIRSGLFKPTYGDYSAGDFIPLDIDLDVEIAYRVGTPLFGLLNDPGKLYRIIDITTEIDMPLDSLMPESDFEMVFPGGFPLAFSLNSSTPAWEQEQVIIIEVEGLMLMGIQQIIIDPVNETMNVVISEESLPVLENLYSELMTYYCSMSGLFDLYSDLSDPEDSEYMEFLENFREMELLVAEVETISAELARTITFESWLIDSSKQSSWTETMDDIRETLTDLESELHQFNRDWLVKEDFDIEVMIPIVLTALDSYEPEIELVPGLVVNSLNSIIEQMDEMD